MTLIVLFDWVLPLGRCIGVRMPKDQSEDESRRPDPELPLVTGEWALADELPSRRRRSWVTGRAAMRTALIREGLEAPAIGRDDRGAPRLPPGHSGSVSHKEVRRSDDLIDGISCERGDVIAVALVNREPVARLGVDVEFDRVPTIDIAPHVLTADEDAALSATDPAERARETVLHFSAKEALYKAVDPFVRRYVGFKEVAVTPHRDGSADVVWNLAPEHKDGPFGSRLQWRRTSGLVVTMARVWRTSGP